MKRIVVPIIIALVVLSMGSYLRSILLFNGSEPLQTLKDRLDSQPPVPVDVIDDDPLSPIKGMTGLMKAAAAGRLDVVQLFVSKGANVEAKDTTFGYTPLMHAIVNKQAVIAEWLINVAHASVNVSSMLGERPVHLVLEIGGIGQEEERKKVQRLLVQKGSDINAITDAQETPLQLAVQRGDLEWVKFLMSEYGPQLKLDIKDKDGRTPLQLANYLFYQDIAIALGGPNGYTR